MQKLNSYRVNLHILSPIHIGAGQELDPFAYTIRNESIQLFDLVKWMDGYENKEKLCELMDSEDFLTLRSYIAQNFDDDHAVLNSIPVRSPEVLSRYQKAIKNKQSENQALVNFMTRNDISHAPYLPGSSIKGAIRTAVASRFASAAGVTKHSARDYNKKIFGLPGENPMKNLKIADLPLDKAGSFIYEAKEHSSKPDKTPKGGFEASASLCETDFPVVFPLHFSLKKFEFHREMIDLSFLVNCLHTFYLHKFKDEYQKFYTNAALKEIQQAIAPMNMAAVRLNTNEAFIRIGHFSHVECVTLDGVRNPKTRKGKNGKPFPWGTTRTLANGLYPFGWAKLEFLDLPSEPRSDGDWPFSIKEIENHMLLKEEAKSKAEAALALADKRRQEAEEKRIAQEKQKAELEAMSPEDRMIAQVNDPNVMENKVVEIFFSMNSFPEDKKILLAEALKGYWQRNNKWKKKKCSKKQWAKVRQIKTILNENG